ncbi:MAG TPA: type II toxin-antitoxin system HipA family toxin, partial [Polyangium sp.]|nr:type II toxin-antitoxin system HipA family toxin [Polyangium sp.]
LLPEGPLRAQVQAELDGRRKHEITLLAALAEDLPGAIRVAASSEETTVSAESTYLAQSPKPAADTLRIRFSLAGVQLKFSVLRRHNGTVTLPAKGFGGDWIVKLPDRQFAGVPINEHAMMTWASLAGLNVPEVGLVMADKLENIDAALFVRPEPAYIVRRFDRSVNDKRIHMEDMAQVFDLYPENKYDRYTYHHIAKVVKFVAGSKGLDEFLRRLVFMVASGNSDMHLKNWSLLYPDGTHAELAPAYDMVATVVYSGVSDELALKLAKSKRWPDVRPASFELIADETKTERSHVHAIVEETIEALVRVQPEAREQSSLGNDEWQRIEGHWNRVPLLKGRFPARAA